MRRRVLFICSGNFYRSRYAEHVFNYYAVQRKLSWDAISRGVATSMVTEAMGALSNYVVEALRDQDIEVPSAPRRPIQLREADLLDCDLPIALDEEEHRPYLDTLFPRWSGKVTYWHVHDLDQWAPEQTLSAIDEQVRRLLDRLARA